MKIELYLNSEKGFIKKGCPYYETVSSKSIATHHGPPTGYWIAKGAFVGFSNEDKEIIKLVTSMADNHNVKLKIYDLAKAHNEYRVYLKGIREIPTVIIGKNKLTGSNITEHHLAEVWKEQTRK